ncbi:MAG: oxidoreductase domain protein, partial [Verrucomicrobiales bacterium]|nr:oxidoreductase domain protein [Verrucomicrobiales bacterium]
LVRSIAAIIKDGGIRVSDELTIMPDPILTGRNEAKLKECAAKAGLDLPVSTDLDAVLADPAYPVFFDASLTQLRGGFVDRAAAAGKAIYCEKPTAVNLAEALRLADVVEKAGVKNGAVQDKLWLPGILKFKALRDSGFFGRILSVRGEFGYWVFTGEDEGQPAQRPSWNYREEDGGGIMVDMFCHWRYLLDNLFGGVKRVSAVGATHIPRRVGEDGQSYEATADDAAYGMFELEGGILCQLNSSWCVRVRRDDLVTFQVDGTEGSAVFGLRKCYSQSRAETPRPVWNPDIEQPIDFFAGWNEVPDSAAGYENAFRIQWELFLRHVVCDEPFRWDLREAAKGVQLAELGLQSWREGRWLEVGAI